MKNFRVLVIADDVARSATVAELAAVGIAPEPAPSMRAALEVLAQAEFDAILVRLQPDAADVEALKMLRNGTGSPILAVIPGVRDVHREEFSKTLAASVKMAADRIEDRAADHAAGAKTDATYAELRQCLTEAHERQEELQTLTSSGIFPKESPRRPAPETVRAPLPTTVESQCSACAVATVCRECGVEPNIARQAIEFELRERRKTADEAKP